ncbi:MAG: lytic transglycosylase domain-containing protein, partial [Candidatus Eisenbacteria bacterium]
GLAPEWAWSIMRRESFFERTVQSGAGAIGLMQFMPATAQQVADAHGLRSEPLRAPSVNLRLGIAHLRDLVDETSGAWPVALAGYNAGIENARRWESPEDDPDLYIETIGYRETREYVKAVLQSFWTYRQLLRGRLTEAP